MATVAVIECVRDDPRLDRQLDARQWYYGELALRLEVDPSRLSGALALPVLGWMAATGQAEARARLRDQVAHGPEWDEALWSLTYADDATGPLDGWQDAVAGLDDALLTRFPTDAALAAALDSANAHRRMPPWSLWAEQPRFARALEREKPHRRTAPTKTRRVTFEALSAADLLAIDEAGLDAADRAAWHRAVVRLPFAHTRERALGELKSPDPLRRRLAASVLAAHAGDEEAPAVRAALARETDQYALCSLAEALGRAPGAGPYPELCAAYATMPYSFGRHFVVAAIAATDPTFADGLAAECRFDCEPATRAIAASGRSSP